MRHKLPGELRDVAALRGARAAMPANSLRCLSLQKPPFDRANSLLYVRQTGNLRFELLSLVPLTYVDILILSLGLLRGLATSICSATNEISAAGGRSSMRRGRPG